MKSVLLLFLLATPAWALDREAFTFTDYDLNVRVEPDQQRIGVRGKITLRNDSDLPQSNLVVQISSTLSWSSIRVEGKPAVFTSQTYTSDIDHTGAMTEAIVILPRAIAPKQKTEVEIGYEGTIPQDETRLTRIGVPADLAKHSDWDRIGSSYSAVRGIGYVGWYPIATEAVSLSEGNSEVEEVGRWKQREAAARMRVSLCVTNPNVVTVTNGSSASAPTPTSSGNSALGSFNCTEHVFSTLGSAIPTFAIAAFSVLDGDSVRVHFLSDHKTGAESYLAATEEAAPLVAKWLSDHRREASLKAGAVELPESDDEPFESGNLLFLPLSAKDTNLLLSSVQQVAHLMFPSFRGWIADGLARYAQVRYIEEKEGRQAALEYLRNHVGALKQSETVDTGEKRDAAAHSLLNADDDFYLQTKAMYVWWMLRDIVGDEAFTAALHDYKEADDKEASYVQKVMEKHAHRDLEWFFDDWVYRDRGLPDFRISYVYPREILNGGYMVTVTVENLAEAAAEVPVVVHTAIADTSEKLVVAGKSNATVRIRAGALPSEVTVNDGSVPESDTSNNSFRIEIAK